MLHTESSESDDSFSSVSMPPLILPVEQPLETDTSYFPDCLTPPDPVSPMEAPVETDHSYFPRYLPPASTASLPPGAPSNFQSMDARLGQRWPGQLPPVHLEDEEDQIDMDEFNRIHSNLPQFFQSRLPGPLLPDVPLDAGPRIAYPDILAGPPPSSLPDFFDSAEDSIHSAEPLDAPPAYTFGDYFYDRRLRRIAVAASRPRLIRNPPYPAPQNLNSSFRHRRHSTSRNERIYRYAIQTTSSSSSLRNNNSNGGGSEAGQYNGATVSVSEADALDVDEPDYSSAVIIDGIAVWDSYRGSNYIWVVDHELMG